VSSRRGRLKQQLSLNRCAIRVSSSGYQARSGKADYIHRHGPQDLIRCPFFSCAMQVANRSSRPSRSGAWPLGSAQIPSLEWCLYGAMRAQMEPKRTRGTEAYDRWGKDQVRRPQHPSGKDTDPSRSARRLGSCTDMDLQSTTAECLSRDWF
jgi:hypothetical protein